MLARLENEPAAWYMTVAAVVAGLLIAFIHPSAVNAALISGAFTAVATVVVAARTRPVDVAAISGALGILVQSLALLGVHWTADQQGAVVATVNLLIGLLAMRLNLTPVSRVAPLKAVA